MKHSRGPRRAKQTPDTMLLVQLASGLGQSCCRIEEDYWEQRLVALVQGLLDNGDESALTSGLDQIYSADERAYNELADLIEFCSETHRIKVKNKGEEDEAELDQLMFIAPMLAWSRFTIPAVAIAPAVLANARVQLQAHVFGHDVRLGLADFLFSPDQLPQSYCDTAALTKELSKSALQGQDLHLDPRQLPETMNFLSDTRYLIGIATVPRGSALFRWQEEDGDRIEAYRQWRTQGGEALRPLLPGCVCEFLLPQPYHVGCREADRLSRPYSINASVAFLSSTLNLAPDDLCAVVAPFYDRQLEEYRIGFARKDSNEVIHGMVWPLLDGESDSVDTPMQIEAGLREAGVSHVLQLEQRFPLEYCDDCGAPLYPNPEGEPVHAELPEEHAGAAPHQLH